MLMTEREILILIYIVVINLIGFLIMGYDKYSAIRNFRRIPEKSLLIIAFIGGAIGIYLGVNSFRHKTKTPLFIYGVPILVLVNIGLFYLLFTS